MSRIAKPKVGRRCPRCKGTSTKQLTNFGRPIRGRFECFDCKRKWDEVHETAPDFARSTSGAPK